MTRDVRVGRVLVAALQQAIAEELPTRAEFYDHWLGPDGRRDGTLGQAPMTAVLGFLRTEGAARTPPRSFVRGCFLRECARASGREWARSKGRECAPNESGEWPTAWAHR